MCTRHQPQHRGRRREFVAPDGAEDPAVADAVRESTGQELVLSRCEGAQVSTGPGSDVAQESAEVVALNWDLASQVAQEVPAHHPSSATTGTIGPTQVFFVHHGAGIPPTAELRLPSVAAAAMALPSASVTTSALRLRTTPV